MLTSWLQLHPLLKILIILSAAQILQIGYVIAHVHALRHGASRATTIAKAAPLAVSALVLVLLIGRMFNIVPWIGF